jgi:hypothetical protein
MGSTDIRQSVQIDWQGKGYLSQGKHVIHPWWCGTNHTVMSLDALRGLFLQWSGKDHVDGCKEYVLLPTDTMMGKGQWFQGKSYR